MSKMCLYMKSLREAWCTLGKCFNLGNRALSQIPYYLQFN